MLNRIANVKASIIRAPTKGDKSVKTVDLIEQPENSLLSRQILPLGHKEQVKASQQGDHEGQSAAAIGQSPVTKTA